MSGEDGEVLVAAELHRPAGRRCTWLVVVRRCPWCGHAHVHRARIALPQLVRAPSCAPARRYVLATFVVPAPREEVTA